uniref:Uncharacterized protein n=1 Tax=Eptatretus burgeri TaxID=7764 RepID=A0A8C4QUU2_EPTBU
MLQCLTNLLFGAQDDENSHVAPAMLTQEESHDGWIVVKFCEPIFEESQGTLHEDVPIEDPNMSVCTHRDDTVQKENHKDISASPSQAGSAYTTSCVPSRGAKPKRHPSHGTDHVHALLRAVSPSSSHAVTAALHPHNQNRRGTVDRAKLQRNNQRSTRGQSRRKRNHSLQQPHQRIFNH